MPTDKTFSAGLAATECGVGLRDAGGKLVDSLGYGTATNAFVEARPATAPPSTPPPGSSDIRLPDGRDTNDNGGDFAVTAAPTPGAPNAAGLPAAPALRQPRKAQGQNPAPRSRRAPKGAPTSGGGP